MVDNNPPINNRKINAKIIAIWLFITASMVMIMTTIGAITRLTESGLSITEWNVITGTIPPLNDTAWQIEFDKYQATPEFIQKHYWMTVDDFKKIFFWEWSHRLWGRLIGLAFGIPFALFWIKDIIPKQDRARFIGLLLLGGAQGFMGWYMVKSGLVLEPAVSHYRLAAHLSLALIIFSTLLWNALHYLRQVKPLSYKYRASSALKIHGFITLGFVATTIIWGAFVAGLDAGLIYNQFPKMGASYIPPEFLSLTPAWINVFENHAAVQFTHRVLAMLTGIIVLSYACHGFKFDKKHFTAIGGMIVIQISLGISTLLSLDPESPMNKGSIHIAATHQCGALIVLALTIMTLHRIIDSRRKISS